MPRPASSKAAPRPPDRNLAGARCCSRCRVALSLSSTQFFTFANLFNLLNTSSVNLIFAVGLLVVLIAGGIDISFAVAASVVQYVAALALIAVGGGGWVSGLLLAAVLGIALGAINAALIYYLPHHLDRRDDRDVQHLLRPADVLHARRVDLQSARLVDASHRCSSSSSRPTAPGPN